MPRPASKYPTDLELQILKVLWQQSPLLARDVQAALGEGGRELAKTSVITTLNTMVGKKYLKRKKLGNMYLFSPRISEDQVSNRMFVDVVDRVFDGSASERADSNWFGQFLFAVDYLDEKGRPIDRADVQIMESERLKPLDDAAAVMLESKQTQRYLLRPSKWLGPQTVWLKGTKPRVVVKYRGDASFVTAPAEFELRSPNFQRFHPQSVARDAKEMGATSLQKEQQAGELPVWGAATNGLRTALVMFRAFTPIKHGDHLLLYMAMQNVSDQPVSFASKVQLHNGMSAIIKNEKRELLDVHHTQFLGETLECRVTLKPQQTVRFDAGDLGLAATQEQVDSFDFPLNRKLVAPAGNYTLQLTGLLGNFPERKDAAGKRIAPVEGDWTGQLTTGEIPLTIINDGLAFLKPYPKLHGLSLGMTEPQFLEIVKQQELKTRKTVEGEKVTHRIALGDGHTLIVMFDKDGKCSGIQRVRGEGAEAKAETVAVPTAAELEKLIQAKGRELFFGRMELAQEFEMLWPTKDQKHEKLTSKGTVRWLKNPRLTRIDSDRMVPGMGTTELHPEKWTTGHDGVHAYSWNRAAKLISYGTMRPGAVAYSPNLLFWGRSAITFPQPMFGPNPKITRTTRDGREELDVVQDVPEAKLSIRYVGIVPNRGYLPTRVETRSNDRLDSQIEFQDFFQPHPGVWAPKTIAWTAWSADNDANGKPIVAMSSKFTVTKLELGDNAKLQDEEFLLKLPDDVKVVDAATANAPTNGANSPPTPRPQPKPDRMNADEKPADSGEGVIESVADKAIEFNNGLLIATDADTKYTRLTDKGEKPVERKELKSGIRVRYQRAPGKGATKVIILPTKAASPD